MFEDRTVLRNTPLLVSSKMGPISFLMHTSSFEETLVWTLYTTESVLESGSLFAASARGLGQLGNWQWTQSATATEPHYRQ